MLNFAIIGCGHIGRRHAEQAASAGTLLAVCDVDKDKAINLGNAYHAKVYADINSLLQSEKKIDVVAVCTPNGLHAAHSIAALQSGFHVLCEKPMALTVADCENMIAAAQKAGKKLFIVKQNRFNPPVAALKKLIDDNRLGRIFSIHLHCLWNRNAAYYLNSWKGSKDLDGGTLYTQFSHFIDLLYWLAGDVKKVAAFTSNIAHKGIISFEDEGVACMEFESGALGSIHFTINSFQKNVEGSLTIVAEKGTVKIGGEYLNKMEYQRIEGYTMAETEPGNAVNDYGHYQGSMSNHDKMYAHVVGVLTKNEENRFDGYSGLKTVGIIEKIYQAANGYAD